MCIVNLKNNFKTWLADKMEEIAETFHLLENTTKIIWNAHGNHNNFFLIYFNKKQEIGIWFNSINTYLARIIFFFYTCSILYILYLSYFGGNIIAEVKGYNFNPNVLSNIETSQLLGIFYKYNYMYNFSSNDLKFSNKINNKHFQNI